MINFKSSIPSIRVVIVEDEELIREAICMLIGSLNGVMVAGFAADGREALRVVAEQSPDVVLMDLRMPVMDGIEATKRIKEKYPFIKVLALTAHNDINEISRGVESGVNGYVLKKLSSRELLVAIETVMEGKNYYCPEVAEVMAKAYLKERDRRHSPVLTLSPRELEVIKLIAVGLRTKEIAGKLGISEKTVEKHRCNLRLKLGATTSAEMMRKYLEF